jgi:hypothetical protein
LVNLLTLSDVQSIFYKKRVVIVGSAPSGLDNKGSHIEDFDVIVRVNNYKTRGIDKRGKVYDFTDKLGTRTDYHYSFYGGSIRKSAEELKADGIKGHLCKCTDDVCHVTQWHIDNHCTFGGDFRGIYRRRAGFFFAPLYIPEKHHYLKLYDLLNGHVPSTGFAGIWEIVNSKPKELYVTGFDFMQSKLHNVNEPWLKGDPSDPIGHDFKAERRLFYKWADEHSFITLDKWLQNGR